MYSHLFVQLLASRSDQINYVSGGPAFFAHWLDYFKVALSRHFQRLEGRGTSFCSVDAQECLDLPSYALAYAHKFPLRER